MAENKLPYSQLAVLGLDKDSLSTLPADVQRELLSGGVTPPITAAIKTSSDNMVHITAKLQVVRGKDGEPMLLIYPMRREIANDLNLPPAQLARLERGEVVVRGLHYMQLDPETKSIISLPESKIDAALADIHKVNDIELGDEQRRRIREGKPVELDVGGEKVTVGLDLRTPQMVDVLDGDMHEWNRRRQRAYDIAHPEYVGLVQTDRNRWEYQQVKHVHEGKVQKEEVESKLKL